MFQNFIKFVFKFGIVQVSFINTFSELYCFVDKVVSEAETIQS